MIHRSCVCNRDLHNYTVRPIPPGTMDKRVVPKYCCRCEEDCLCHG